MIEITTWAGMQQLYRHPAVDGVKVEKVFSDIKDAKTIKDIIKFSLMNTCAEHVKGRVAFDIFFPISKTERLHVHYRRADNNEANGYFRVALQEKQGGRWPNSEPKHVDMLHTDIMGIEDTLENILNYFMVKVGKAA